MSSPKSASSASGCPKALVDSERILTQLRTEGLRGHARIQRRRCRRGQHLWLHRQRQGRIARSDRRGHRRKRQKVIVTGCMGVEESVIRQVHPSVLAVTGPQQYEEVVRAVHGVAPPRQDHQPVPGPGPAARRQADAAPLCLPEDFRRLQPSLQLLHHPSMRGDLVSRPVGDVLSEAERLVRAGVKELLVISQDTSAYGVDIKYRSGFWNGRPVKTRMTELCAALSELGVDPPALRLSVSARGRSDRPDDRRQGAALSGHPVPACQPAHPARRYEAPGVRGTRRWRASSAGARSART